MPYVELSRSRGLDFCKSIIAVAQAKGGREAAEHIARGRYGLQQISKAAAGSVTLGDLGGVDSMAVEFFDRIRENSIVGGMRGLREIPFETPMVNIVAGAIAAFIKQGMAIPVSKVELNTGRLPIRSYGALTAATEEFLRAGNADRTLRNDLTTAGVEALDKAFIDPDNAGVTDILPASVTNGVTPVVSTGDPAADFAALVDDFAGDLGSAYLVTTPTIAVSFHSAGFEGAGARGGEVAGVPLITSRHVPEGVIVLIDPTGVQAAFGGGAVAASQHCTLQMDTEPTNDSAEPTGTELVSLWQCNTTAFRLVGYANWQSRREGSVSLMTGANYTGS